MLVPDRTNPEVPEVAFQRSVVGDAGIGLFSDHGVPASSHADWVEVVRVSVKGDPD